MGLNRMGYMQKLMHYAINPLRISTFPFIIFRKALRPFRSDTLQIIILSTEASLKILQSLAYFIESSNPFVLAAKYREFTSL